MLSFKCADAHGMEAWIGDSRDIVARGSLELFTAHKAWAPLFATEGPSDFACGARHMASAPGAAVPVLAKCAQVSEATTKLWHHRYAHLGYRGLAKLVSSKIVTGTHVREDSARLRRTSASRACLSRRRGTRFPPPSIQSARLRWCTGWQAPWTWCPGEAHVCQKKALSARVRYLLFALQSYRVIAERAWALRSCNTRGVYMRSGSVRGRAGFCTEQTPCSSRVKRAWPWWLEKRSMCLRW